MKVLVASLILFLTLSSTVFAQTPSFSSKVLVPPDVAFLWNFQRGAEEVYRFVKFSTTMRVDYSLQLADRRIGEMEFLINKSEEDMLPMVENSYDMEISKISMEMSTNDIFSEFTNNVDIKHNVTERLQYDIGLLNILSREVTGSSSDYIVNSIKKTSACIDAINKL